MNQARASGDLGLLEVFFERDRNTCFATLFLFIHFSASARM
jgi:hypothetical protein